MEKQQNESKRDSYELQKHQLKHPFQNIQSELGHLQMYNSFFSSIPNIQIDDYLAYHLPRLYENKIEYNKLRFTSQPIFFVLNQFGDGNILHMHLQLSYFTFEIVILKIAGPSKVCLQGSKIGYGGSGSIFQINLRGKKKFVIKSINIGNKAHNSLKSGQNIQTALKQVIKQYSLTKLFSVLQIGPKVLNQLGFDLIIYENSVQFCLQKCSSHTSANQTIEQFLKTQLKIYHSLSIIHGDIKPQNFMWSNQYKKMVFIDFGFAAVLNQAQGKLTLTSFFGTLNYCSPEMRRLYQVKSFALIDLYYNDLYCLKKSLAYYSESIEVKGPDLQRQEQAIIVNTFNNLCLMRLIYNRDLKSIIHLLQRDEKIIINQTALRLFQMLPTERILLQIFCLLQKYQQFSDDQSERIKKYHSSVVRTPLQLEQNQMKMDGVRSPPPTWFMLYILIFMGQDVTLRAKARKQELFKSLKKFSSINIDFCQMLVQYTSNLYTNDDNILQILKFTLSLLDSQQISSILEQPKYIIYGYSYLIHSKLLQKCSINILQIYDQQRSKQVNRIENQIQSDHGHLLQYFSFWKKKLSDGCKPSNQFLQGRAQIRSQKLISLFQNCVGQIQPQVFSTECSKMYAAKKCIFMKFLDKKAEIKIFLRKSLQSYLRFKFERSLKLVNYCFERQTLLDFLYSSTVELQMLKGISVRQMEKEIKKIEHFMYSAFSTEIFESFSDTLMWKLTRNRSYSIYQNQQLMIFWVKSMKRLHDCLLNMVINGQKSKDLTFVYKMIKIYSVFRLYLPKHEFASITKFIHICQNIWPALNSGSQFTIDFIQSKTLILQNFGRIERSNISGIVTKISSFIPHLKTLGAIEAHLMLLKFHLFYTCDEEEYEKNIDAIFCLIPKVTICQGQKYLETVTLNPSICQYFFRESEKVGYRLDKYFQFLQFNLRIFHTLQENNFGKHFFFYLQLRQIVRPFLKAKQKLIQLIRMLLEWMKSVMKRGRRDQIKCLGNSVAIIQIFFVAIINFKFYQQLGDTANSFLRLLPMIIQDASFIIRRYFANKIFTIILEFAKTKNGLNKIYEKRGLLRWEKKQYRNPQYPCHDSRVEKLLFKIEKKKNCREFYKRLKEKLLVWNQNKKKAPFLNQTNLRSPSDVVYEIIISQNSIRSCVTCDQILYEKQSKYQSALLQDEIDQSSDLLK